MKHLLRKIEPFTNVNDYNAQLNFINAVQMSVLANAPLNKGIPKNQTREPKDLLSAGNGLCYDRSRTIEKILRYSGLETRHVSFYSSTDTVASLTAILKPNTPSHAVTEVLTASGWLVVDSNSKWVSVDRSNNPISIEMIAKSIKNSKYPLFKEPPPAKIYKNPFIHIYGLYSRHGRFYPPYNWIPDINYQEFLHNLI
jgi:transglutaminase-like putative cysteine protease